MCISFYWYMLSFLLCKYLSGIGGSKGNPMFTFKEMTKHFSKAPFTSPAAVLWKFQLLHILTNTVYGQNACFYFSFLAILHKDIVVFHYCINFNFYKTSNVENSFILFIYHLYLFLDEVAIQIFCYFLLIWLFPYYWVLRVICMLIYKSVLR